ncbi:MAG: hypothetical protein ACI4D4_03125 [Lachnospira sp.]
MVISRDTLYESKLFKKLQVSKEELDSRNINIIGTKINSMAALVRALREETAVAELKKSVDEVIAAGILDKLPEGELGNFKIGNGLYTLASFTGEEKYKDEAVKLAAQFNIQKRDDKGYFVDKDGEICLCKTYLYQSFFMNYETKNGGKERYNDIIAQYNCLYKDKFADTVKDLRQDSTSFFAVASFAAALVDTMEVMDQMLYEIYRKMQDYYKDAVKAVLSSDINPIDSENEACLLFDYAVLKGCRMKALQTEKYENKVIGVKDAILTSDLEKDSDEIVGLKAMVYSELIRNREYQDYGRGKGGALWS